MNRPRDQMQLEMATEFAKIRKQTSDLAYEYLRRKNYSLFRRVIETADVLAIQANLALSESAKVESAMVKLVASIIQQMENDNVDKPDNS